MAHIPMDDIEELWRETPEKNWGEFHRVLEQHSGKADGISQNLIMMMLPAVQNLEKSGTPFPDSPDKLSDMLNQNLGKYEQQGENLDEDMM